MFRFPFLPASVLLGHPAMAPDLTSLQIDPSGPVGGSTAKRRVRSRHTTAQDKRAAAKRRAIKRARKLGHV